MGGKVESATCPKQCSVVVLTISRNLKTSKRSTKGFKSQQSPTQTSLSHLSRNGRRSHRKRLIGLQRWRSRRRKRLRRQAKSRRMLKRRRKRQRRRRKRKSLLKRAREGINNYLTSFLN